ncbi:MAG: hypothetical protein Q7J34_01615 [Bacteroidales bacterium]|jgi:hypothetical protein|nr:hypothetical protein [Bacteroidales bacterium]
MIKKIYSLLIVLSLFGASCGKHMQKSQISQKPTQEPISQIQVPSPPVIIYKTRGNYLENVPVGLSSDKRNIVSYPDKNDVKNGGQFLYPDKLASGFLFDNLGITAESGFLKITYTEYSRLEKTPSNTELIKLIADDNPFTEMYRCPRQLPKDKMIDELNTRIMNNTLEERCNKIK